MEKNIERALSHIQTTTFHESNNYYREQTRLKKELRSPISRLINGRYIKAELEQTESNINNAEKTADILGIITNISFHGDNAWTVSINPKGQHFEIQKEQKNDEFQYYLKGEGELVYKYTSDEIIKVCSSVADRIKGELYLSNVVNQAREEGERRLRGRSGENTSSKDPLGYFKTLGIDPDIFEGLTHEEIVTRIIVNHGLTKKSINPESEDFEARTKEIDKALSVLVNGETRQDYMKNK